tara:strand:- start:429 stop:704 length:276 start_codon:yes stop_codon:yes gene_type:complete
MEDYLTLWWVWISAGLILGVIELLASGFIFLGFAIGALAMAVFVFVLPAANVPALLAMFAILSLIAWLGLRLIFRRQSGGARIVKRDINEN